MFMMRKFFKTREGRDLPMVLELVAGWVSRYNFQRGRNVISINIEEYAHVK
jgi:hypothetical protein